MVVCSDDKSSAETGSLYQLQDGRISGGSADNSIPDSPDLPNRASIFMAGTQSAPHSSAAAIVLSGSTKATPTGAGSSVPPPAQVLSDLFDTLATLMAAEVDAAARDQHNMEIAKVKDQIAQAKVDLAAKNYRMATERAELGAQAYRIRLDQNASEEVMRRRYRSHLPLGYERRNLFNTPGAGTSNQPMLNRMEVPGTGAPVQPRMMDPPR